MAIIKLNYDLAISQAKTLENAADQCKEMVSKVKRQLVQLETGWSGESASAMAEKLSQWNRETTLLEGQLRQQAANIRKKADLLKAIDEEENAANGTAEAGNISSGICHGGGGRSW